MLNAVALVLTLAQAAPGGVPEPPSPPVGPYVALNTTLGRIVIGLHRDKAPITVANFLKYVRSGHYDHTIFHRKIANALQGGGYEEDLSEHPTRPPIKNESMNGLSNRRGALAMARAGAPDSAMAQFFVNLKDNLFYDGRPGQPGYAVFGEVVDGMDVVDRIAALPTKARGRHPNMPTPTVEIKSAREVAAPKPKATPAAPKIDTPTPAPEGSTASPEPTPGP
jgi:peptidyl-prolyl cis-trans isomerase A (cyclophilin A)